MLKGAIKWMVFILLLLMILSYPKFGADQAPAPDTSSATKDAAPSLVKPEVMDPDILLEAIQVRYVNETRYIDRIQNVTRVYYDIRNKTQYVNEYVTLNLTPYQTKSLMNMKPNVCHTAGCSDGFDKCKRQALGIMELKAPKFRETFSTGYDPFFRQNESQVIFRISEDKRGQFINLNGSHWYITVPAVWEYINETKIRNETFRVDRENIKIRKID